MNVENWDAWPFDEDFHLLINLAFGGNWGGYDGIFGKKNNRLIERVGANNGDRLYILHRQTISPSTVEVCLCCL